VRIAAGIAQQQATDAIAQPARLQRVESNDLLAMLRVPDTDGASKYRYNIFTQQIEILGEVAEGIERFYLQLAEEGWKVPKDMAMDCLIKVARENPYDPVALYLEHVHAEVPPTYIDRLATTYLRPCDANKPEPTLYDHMLKKTLIGAVKRIFEPGCKHDYACVLMGEQGARKSSFWSALGGAFFSDALRDISSKDDLMVLHRSWIMEWAELDHITSKKHAGQVKAFLSQSTDLFRVPYGKATETFPRRSIIVGSTNRDSGFLVDDTGNRRFWVIPVTCTLSEPIDVPNLILERDSIWAAAVAAYKAGESNELALDQQQAVEAENVTYLVESPWKAPIEQWLAHPGNHGRPITSEVLLNEAINKPVERQTRSDQMQVASILRDLGLKKRRQMVGGTQKWVFFQPA
jgi:predicted P-loop ATPase